MSNTVIDTINFSIVAGKHGGLVVYESVGDDHPQLVFGGNIDEFTSYVQRRAADLHAAVADAQKAEKPKAEPAAYTRSSLNDRITSLSIREDAA